MRRHLVRQPHTPRSDGRLLRVLLAVFAFNLGVAAWSAVVVGRLVQQGQGDTLVGTLFALCELARLPGAVLLPILTLRFGVRRVGLAGLVGLAALPVLAIPDLDSSRAMLGLVAAALPSMAIYVVLPALVIGAAGAGRDGWALAWLGLVGGAGGGVGPWVGGGLADLWGPTPVLVLFAASSLLLLPLVARGALPPASPWPGWAVLVGRKLPWEALGALALASAADAGRAALVPAELVRQGLPLAQAGLLLSIGCAVAGTGFLLFGRLADRHSARRVLGAGLAVLVTGSFALVAGTGWSVGYALAAAVLGMGASGIRLGAQVALIDWLGREQVAVAAALGETTVLSGRAVGAPTLGVLSDAHGDGSAFALVGLAGLLTVGLVALAARWKPAGHRLPAT